MAKKPLPRSGAQPRPVTLERAARLYRLLQLVGEKPHTRDALRRRLKLDVRGFYRDLELLRTSGIELAVVNGRYLLREPGAKVLSRLPFPDPRLTLGEAAQLAKGRTAAHRKLRTQLARIEGRQSRQHGAS